MLYISQQYTAAIISRVGAPKQEFSVCAIARSAWVILLIHNREDSDCCVTVIGTRNPFMFFHSNVVVFYDLALFKDGHNLHKAKYKKAIVSL